MKTILILLFFHFLAAGQNPKGIEVRIVKVDGIVVSNYKRNSLGSYCINDKTLIIGFDTLHFIPRSGFNKTLIEKYSFINEYIGPITDYDSDYLLDWTYKNPKNDLTLSPYDFHSQEKGIGHFVESKEGFYYRHNDSLLTSIYWFSGEVIVYEGINPFERNQYEIKSNLVTFYEDLEDHCETICQTYKNFNLKRFAVLKETIDVFPIEVTKALEMGYSPTGIIKIGVFLCE